jgi:flagellar biosynthesis protein FlhB
MSVDELKRYPPTPRRLERLRQTGDVPFSGAVNAVAVLAAGTAAAVVLGPGLCGRLGALLARDLQRCGGGLATPETAVAQFTGHLAQAFALMVIIAFGAAAILILAHLAQTGFAVGRGPGGSASRSPFARLSPGPGRRRGERPVLESIIGLGAVALVLKLLLADLAGTPTWDDAWRGGSWWGLWGRWIAVLAGLSMTHLLVVRARYWQRAAMSHRELADETRETTGAPLNRELRERRRRGMLSRG